MTTAGLDNVGEPADGLPLHGTYNYLAATAVEADGNRISGTIADARGVVLQRQIVNDPDRGHLRVADTTTNTSDEPQPAPLLYHCNLLWGEVDIDSDAVAPRDAASAAEDWHVVGHRERARLRASRRDARARPRRRAGRRDPLEPPAPLAVDRPRPRSRRHRAGELLHPRPRLRRFRRAPADARSGRIARDVTRHRRHAHRPQLRREHTRASDATIAPIRRPSCDESAKRRRTPHMKRAPFSLSPRPRLVRAAPPPHRLRVTASGTLRRRSPAGEPPSGMVLSRAIAGTSSASSHKLRFARRKPPSCAKR